MITSYAAAAPKGVAVEPLLEAVAVWRVVAARELPTYTFAWAYITRARHELQLALVDQEPAPLVAEALVNCERYFTFATNAAVCQAFTLANRLFGLYGLTVDLLETTAISAEPGAGRPVSRCDGRFDDGCRTRVRSTRWSA